MLSVMVVIFSCFAYDGVCGELANQNIPVANDDAVIPIVDLIGVGVLLFKCKKSIFCIFIETSTSVSITSDLARKYRSTHAQLYH